MENNILESLKADMLEQEKLFNGIRDEIVKLANEYNAKLKEYSKQMTELNNTIVEVEAEGNRELKKLQEQQEYYRGAYTCLYNQYVKFGGNSGNVKVEEDNNVVIDSEKPDKKSVDTAAKSTKKSTKKSISSKQPDLSEEDLKKIQTIASSVDKKVKEEDIPDYLKAEYNK